MDDPRDKRLAIAAMVGIGIGAVIALCAVLGVDLYLSSR